MGTVPDEHRAAPPPGRHVREVEGAVAGELELALAHVDNLHGILPVCSYCKKVRTDGDSWQQMEAYVSAHSTVRFNHGVCPSCEASIVQPQLQELRRARALREKGKQ